MKIKLIDVGREKVCKEIEGIKDMSGALDYVRGYLLSREVELIENEKRSSVLCVVYDMIVGGFRKVGEVECY